MTQTRRAFGKTVFATVVVGSHPVFAGVAPLPRCSGWWEDLPPDLAKPWPPETVELCPMAAAVGVHDTHTKFAAEVRELAPDWAREAEKIAAEAMDQILTLPTCYPPSREAKRLYLSKGIVTPIP